MKLMVIDDDPDLREALADVLAANGYHVEVAPDGAVALGMLERVGERRPDALVLDWRMPRMDGLEFRRRQRADPRLAEIPVVLMTASSVHLVPLAEIEPEAAVTKPVAVADLLGAIERVLRPR